MLKKLDAKVIARIKAGEVVQNPSNVVKELLENSLDAGSKTVKVEVRGGGLKQLVIRDGGSGIQKASLSLLCERHTTSKIDTLEDLRSVATLGFRGEALASVSHVSHVRVLTRTSDSLVAFEVRYVQGKMEAPPKVMAGSAGTTFFVEDLFFNEPLRRKKVAKNARDEYRAVLHVVSMYAVHRCDIAFSCRSLDDGVALPTLASSGQMTRVEVLERVFPRSARDIARHMLDLDVEHAEPQFEAHVLASTLDFDLPPTDSFETIFFINERLVSCAPLRRAIASVYKTLSGGNKRRSLAYVALSMPPQHVDVNVHPTKNEVVFLAEARIAGIIARALSDKLRAHHSLDDDELATLEQVQQIVAADQLDDDEQIASSSSSSSSSLSTFNDDIVYGAIIDDGDADDERNISFAPADVETRALSESAPPPPRRMQRRASDDAVSMAFAPSLSQVEYSPQKKEKPDDDAQQKKQEKQKQTRLDDFVMMEDDDDESKKDDDGSSRKRRDAEHRAIDNDDDADRKRPRSVSQRRRSMIQLTSVRCLLRDVDASLDVEMLEVLQQAEVVAAVPGSDDLQCVVRSGGGGELWSVSVEGLMMSLGYQLSLIRMGRCARIPLEPPVPLLDAICLAINDQMAQAQSQATPEEIDDAAQSMADLLCTHRAMLNEYWSIEIDDEDRLCALPLLFEFYVPQMGGIPELLLSMATRIVWNDERQCFHSMAIALANFYAPSTASLWTEYRDVPASSKRFTFTRRGNGDKPLERALAAVRDNPALYLLAKPHRSSSAAAPSQSPPAIAARARYFVAQTIDDFYDDYRKRAPTDRFSEDVLRQGCPVNFFADLECEVSLAENKGRHVYMDRMLATFKRYVGDQWLSDTSAPAEQQFCWTEFDASALPAHKMSRHLHCSTIAFADVDHMYTFMCRVERRVFRDARAGDPDAQLLVVYRDKRGKLVEELFVDMTVFTNNRCLRLPWASKPGQYRPLLPVIDGVVAARATSAPSKPLLVAALSCRVLPSTKPFAYPPGMLETRDSKQAERRRAAQRIEQRFVTPNVRDDCVATLLSNCVLPMLSDSSLLLVATTQLRTDNVVRPLAEPAALSSFLASASQSCQAEQQQQEEANDVGEDNEKKADKVEAPTPLAVSAQSLSSPPLQNYRQLTPHQMMSPQTPASLSSLSTLAKQPVDDGDDDIEHIF
jgi:DNA mismatch repair protein MLH1